MDLPDFLPISCLTVWKSAFNLLAVLFDLAGPCLISLLRISCIFHASRCILRIPVLPIRQGFVLRPRGTLGVGWIPDVESSFDAFPLFFRTPIRCHIVVLVWDPANRLRGRTPGSLLLYLNNNQSTLFNSVVTPGLWHLPLLLCCLSRVCKISWVHCRDNVTKMKISIARKAHRHLTQLEFPLQSYPC